MGGERKRVDTSSLVFHLCHSLSLVRPMSGKRSTNAVDRLLLW